MRKKIKLDTFSGFAMVAIFIVACMKVAVIYHWIQGTGEYSTSPFIYKGVKYPFVSFLTVAITIYALVCLLVPSLRTIPRVAFLGSMLFCFGIASAIGMWYLSPNVMGPIALYALFGLHLYGLSKKEYKKLSGE